MQTPNCCGLCSTLPIHINKKGIKTGKVSHVFVWNGIYINNTFLSVYMVVLNLINYKWLVHGQLYLVTNHPQHGCYHKHIKGNKWCNMICTKYTWRFLTLATSLTCPFIVATSFISHPLVANWRKYIRRSVDEYANKFLTKTKQYEL